MNNKIVFQLAKNLLIVFCIIFTIITIVLGLYVVNKPHSLYAGMWGEWSSQSEIVTNMTELKEVSKDIFYIYVKSIKYTTICSLILSIIVNVCICILKKINNNVNKA